MSDGRREKRYLVWVEGSSGPYRFTIQCTSTGFDEVIALQKVAKRYPGKKITMIKEVERP